ncbi:unnamed protein product [Rotaria sp. Silwood2]|nr:unnamed protein product [Rotaria sp. Silwood2]CAF2574204.1 unnamed protein product [Rotaria sp. Silwood2]CAF2902802.1 unnamed protein product [Rotaria sp. Silwood2]CAF3877567.1 unnamed protein product [Rotaria sp. Silwood2]CAF4219352.1 unnamed protein product [Rotaria sp. Silwood2]
MLVQTSTIRHHSKHRYLLTPRDCSICGSKAVGVNFGALTCAPCKAFFRRNARRKEILQLPCQLMDSNSSIYENKNPCNNNNNICSQVRYCTSCRLRRCFDVGMKTELVRTDEEKQRYRELIELNRERKQELLKLSENKCLQIAPLIAPNDELLKETDWRLLSNIVYAYDNYCLKIFAQARQNIFNNEINFSEQPLSKIHHHTAMRLCNIKSFLSFLSSIPIIQSLSISDRYYLCKHNIRSLIFPNLHEIEQTCFTESWQVNIDNTAAEYVYGKKLFADCVQMKKKAESILITDPAVTRLWLLVLFFSTPLICYYDRSLPGLSHKSRLDLNKIQHSFINLLWNYLSHRHGYFDAVRIFSNVICIYLQMQRISQAINHELRTRNDLNEMNQAFNRAIAFENDILSS